VLFHWLSAGTTTLTTTSPNMILDNENMNVLVCLQCRYVIDLEGQIWRFWRADGKL